MGSPSPGARLPDGSRDMESEKSVLLEAGFDELNGVSWTKGCYMGQELTRRAPNIADWSNGVWCRCASMARSPRPAPRFCAMGERSARCARPWPAWFGGGAAGGDGFAALRRLGDGHSAHPRVDANRAGLASTTKNSIGIRHSAEFTCLGTFPDILTSAIGVACVVEVPL